MTIFYWLFSIPLRRNAVKIQNSIGPGGQHEKQLVTQGRSKKSKISTEQQGPIEGFLEFSKVGEKEKLLDWYMVVKYCR